MGNVEKAVKKKLARETAVKLLKNAGEKLGNKVDEKLEKAVGGELAGAAGGELAEILGKKLEEAVKSEDAFKQKLKQMTDGELAAAYIPDVYQKDIFMVDYEKWREQGIKLISFDIDDTLAALEAKEPSETVRLLFRDLKRMGFTVVLLTNGKAARGEKFAEKLGVDYVAEAKKPYYIGFLTVLSDYEEQFQEKLEKSQMAHVGNHLTADIMGGNMYGITTCLVRRVGKCGAVGAGMRKALGVNINHIVREELKNRKLWYAHHQKADGDQYYQLGEAPEYQKAKQNGWIQGKLGKILH